MTDTVKELELLRMYYRHSEAPQGLCSEFSFKEVSRELKALYEQRDIEYARRFIPQTPDEQADFAVRYATITRNR